MFPSAQKEKERPRHRKRYRSLADFFREAFGCRVQKITVDAGLNCPNRDGTLSKNGCIYCNSRGSGTGAHARGLDVQTQIMEGRKAMARRYKAKKFMAYFQSFSNTYAPLPELKSLYDAALSAPDMAGLCIGTRPDCVDDAVLDLLQEYAKDYMVWIEYGLQSAHDRTLNLINRGHDFRCFQKAVHAARNRGIHICAHVILGLPGESGADMLDTAKAVARSGLDGIKLHLLYVVRGTALAALYEKGEYACLEQEAYAGLVCDFLELLPEDMVIQRLTGDPHPEELIAPPWSLEKRKTLEMIKKTLEHRDTWQGRLFTGQKFDDAAG